MKKKLLTTICTLLISIILFSQEKNTLNNSVWHIIDNTNTEYVLQLKLMKGKFMLFSRKGSSKNIIPSKYLLGRLVGKVNSSAIQIKGKYHLKNDTLFLKGQYKSLTSKQDFLGTVVKDSLSASLTRNQYRGSRIGSLDSLKDYHSIIKKALAYTESNLYDTSILQSKEWLDFKTDVLSRSQIIKDDYEFSLMYNSRVRKLPFSHYGIEIFQTDQKEVLNEEIKKPETQKFSLKQIDSNTMLLTIKTFAATKEEIIPYIDSLKKKKVDHLIIDLRNNTGGSISSALPLARYLVNDTLYGGLFLTQKYFLKNTSLPKIEEYKKFPLFSEANFDLILNGIHNEEGLCLVVYPDDVTYTGNIYVLVNKHTASTCEPLVYGLKREKRAIIIGEKTAGEMLNGEKFQIANNMRLWIPTADFYTVDGLRIDKVGVEPHVKVKPDRALNKTLQLIKKSTQQ